jgi:hypothetical protein
MQPDCRLVGYGSTKGGEGGRASTENLPMINFRGTSAALGAGLALGLALALTSTPAMAKQRVSRSGYAARDQAIGEGGATLMNGSRAAALRECNNKAAPLRDYTWGMEQSDLYRSCMAQHGQPE